MKINELLQTLNKSSIVKQNYLSDKSVKVKKLDKVEYIVNLMSNFLNSKAEKSYIFDREYGLGLHDKIFDLNDDITLNVIKDRIESLLAKEFQPIPNVQVQRIDDKHIKVIISFSEDLEIQFTSKG